MHQLTLITWDDPRGYGAMEAVAEAFGNTALERGVKVVWDVQPLGGFESHPLEELAKRYDLINMDHPHVGDAVASGCLLPMAELANEYVGPSWESYRMNGVCWAVPIDAACQVAAYRADRIDAPPRKYDQVFELARRGVRVGASLRGIHALMAMFTLLAQMGHAVGTEIGQGLPESRFVIEAANWLRRLQRVMIAASFDSNPLELFAAMQRGECDYAVFTFAYVSAGHVSGQKNGIRFAPVASMNDGPSKGAVLGGTGLGVSAHSKQPEVAKAFARFVGSREIQTSLWPKHGGQPAHRSAWEELAKTDRFYRDLMPTMKSAYVRPRFAGWNHLQSQAGGIVNEWLRSSTAPAMQLDRRLRECWNQFGSSFGQPE